VLAQTVVGVGVGAPRIGCDCLLKGIPRFVRP
jgi:hypothetical protein